MTGTAHFDWGIDGALALPDSVIAVAIVDVLSFSTCVDVAVSQGAEVAPYPFGVQGAREEAARIGASVVGKRSDPDACYTLSPESLLDIEAGTQLLVPSPNGSATAHALGARVAYAGCFRNRCAVAAALKRHCREGDVAVIAAGERWPESGGLRPAIEDLLGAGAILDALDKPAGSDAGLARASWAWAQENLERVVMESPSGQELIGRGFAGDVTVALELDTSKTAPCRTGTFFRDVAAGGAF